MQISHRYYTISYGNIVCNVAIIRYLTPISIKTYADTSQGKTDSEKVTRRPPIDSSKHHLLAKPCVKALHFAKSGGAVYNDHGGAQPMASD